MAGYGTREVATLLGLTPAQIRSCVSAGFLTPARGAGRAFRFSFQDLLVLRSARELLDARIPPQRVRRAMKALRAQLGDRPLTGVRLSAEGDQVVVRDGAARWQPESGQSVFDFGVDEIARRVGPLLAEAAAQPSGFTAEDFYAWAVDLEDVAPDQAREAYGRALEREPDHAGALVNLGRLLQEAGAAAAAEAHYRRALAAHPDDDTAAFNLGVVLEDLGRPNEALEAYERAIALNESLADAYFNAARLCEEFGQKPAALRYLKRYRQFIS